MARPACTSVTARRPAAAMAHAPNAATASVMNVTMATTAVRCAADRESVHSGSASAMPATWGSSASRSATVVAPVRWGGTACSVSVRRDGQVKSAPSPPVQVTPSPAPVTVTAWLSRGDASANLDGQVMRTFPLSIIGYVS